MSSHTTRPKWWQLYLALPLLIGLFTLDHGLTISERGHQAVQIGTVLVVFGLACLWLRANAEVLSEMDRARYGYGVTEIRVPPAGFAGPGLDDENPGRFSLPGREVKGLLEHPFGRDIVDAESYPFVEAAQEFRKEAK